MYMKKKIEEEEMGTGGRSTVHYCHTVFTGASTLTCTEARPKTDGTRALGGHAIVNKKMGERHAGSRLKLPKSVQHNHCLRHLVHSIMDGALRLTGGSSESSSVSS
jgi:hypothetical protein